MPQFQSVKERLCDPDVTRLLSYSVFEESLDRAKELARLYRENNEQQVYAWMDQDVVLGVCAFETKPDKLIINNIAVDKDYRCVGVGTIMIKELRRMYSVTIEAETDDGAVEFYRKRGFDTVESEKRGVRRWKCSLRARDILYRVIPLERDVWAGYVLPFHYISEKYYEVEINRADNDFSVSFVEKSFDAPFEYVPEKDYDKLFQSHWNDIKAWGIVEDGRLIAAVETAVEEWSNRLRITELWVNDDHRRQGIGAALMDIALKRARDEKRRAVMLETQSRNWNAISFYLAYGFTLIGFNTCEYSNNDFERKEIRIEMGMLLT